MIEKKAFEELVKRVGPDSVQEALRVARYRKVDSKNPPSDRDLESLSKGVRLALKTLFGANLSTEDLWKEYQGVSEPATVPRQSLRAGDTPGSGGRNGS